MAIITTNVCYCPKHDITYAEKLGCIECDAEITALQPATQVQQNSGGRLVRKSLDDCTGEEWNAASKAAGWGSPSTVGTELQPAPVVRNDKPASWDLVLADMAERDKFGKSKYGMSLQPGNGRDALADAYQEALDLAVYLRTAIYERDGK